MIALCLKFWYNQNMDKFDLIITSASGVESVVKNELRTLGFTSPRCNDGKILLSGNGYDIARINMFSGSADRVYIKLTSFYADTFDMLFEYVNSFDWIPILPFNAKIIVTGKSKSSKLFALSSIQSIIKKAILTRLSQHYKRKVFPENGVVYRIEFHIDKDEVTLLLNTSGDGLHKRGYRDLVGEAPIRETLAYAMLSLSDFSAENPFCDPFCGSGTIVIEGARKALGIAPGRDRKFDFTYWDFIPSDAYKIAREEAIDRETPDKKLRFYGFDINPDAISIASHHAEKAGVRNKIHLQVQDVANFKNRYKNGCIVTNPPYGERLMDATSVAGIYKTLGNVYKELDNWSLFAITSAPNFEKAFGKKAPKNRKLYNSNKECHFYMYSKKDI